MTQHDYRDVTSCSRSPSPRRLVPVRPCQRRRCRCAAPRYAITNARIVTAAGAAIEKGTLVMRDGVIEDVGAAVAAPADALVVDGTGLVVYPGLIDMSNSTVVEGGGAPAPARPLRRRRRRPAAAAARRWPRPTASPGPTRSARRGRGSCIPTSRRRGSSSYEGDDLRRLAAAGITSALAVPAQGIIRGQSALVNVTAPPDPSETSALATYRRGVVVVRSPVAQHVVFDGGRRRRRGVAAGIPARCSA